MTERLPSPNPDSIKAARTLASHTQTEAAVTVHSTDRRWRDWESGAHKMPPAAWELYLLRTQAIIFKEPPALVDMAPVTRTEKEKEPCVFVL